MTTLAVDVDDATAAALAAAVDGSGVSVEQHAAYLLAWAAGQPAMTEVLSRLRTDTIASRILRHLATVPACSGDELAAALGGSAHSTRTVLSLLAGRGLVERVRRGSWRITESGRAALARGWVVLSRPSGRPGVRKVGASHLILDHLGSVDSATTVEVERTTGLSHGTVTVRLRAMAKEGRVVQIERGRYALPGRDGATVAPTR